MNTTMWSGLVDDVSRVWPSTYSHLLFCFALIRFAVLCHDHYTAQHVGLHVISSDKGLMSIQWRAANGAEVPQRDFLALLLLPLNTWQEKNCSCHTCLHMCIMCAISLISDLRTVEVKGSLTSTLFCSSYSYVKDPRIINNVHTNPSVLLSKFHPCKQDTPIKIKHAAAGSQASLQRPWLTALTRGL